MSAAKAKKPEYIVFTVYGNFNTPIDLNVIIVRIPGKGINWHKQVLPGIRKILKPYFGKQQDKHWNVEGDFAQAGNKTLWECEIPQKFDWINGQFIEVWKGKSPESRGKKI